MEKFILNITASSGEFYQGYCESLTLHSPDSVQIHLHLQLRLIILLLLVVVLISDTLLHTYEVPL